MPRERKLRYPNDLRKTGWRQGDEVLLTFDATPVLSYYVPSSLRQSPPYVATAVARIDEIRKNQVDFGIAWSATESPVRFVPPVSEDILALQVYLIRKGSSWITLERNQILRIFPIRTHGWRRRGTDAS